MNCQAIKRTTLNRCFSWRHAALAAALLPAGCAYYPELDYVRYEGIDYGYMRGSEQKTYYRDHGRQTSKTDKIFQFAIGQKKFREFNSDYELAARTITKQVFDKEGFCPQGYDIKYDKNITGGDHGFIWKVFCR
jgi:hypothetical protein